MSRESKSSAKNETVDVPNDTITAESPTEAEGPAPENRQGKEELEAIVRQGAVDVPGDMGTAEPEQLGQEGMVKIRVVARMDDDEVELVTQAIGDAVRRALKEPLESLVELAARINGSICETDRLLTEMGAKVLRERAGDSGGGDPLTEDPSAAGPHGQP